MESEPVRDQIRRALHDDHNESLRTGERPPMLDIRPSRGAWLALPYLSLREVKYDPDAKPPLTIEFSSYMVEVEGHRLEGLYHALVGQRASVLAAVQALYVDDGETRPVVERVVVKRKQRQDSAGEQDGGRSRSE